MTFHLLTIFIYAFTHFCTVEGISPDDIKNQLNELNKNIENMSLSLGLCKKDEALLGAGYMHKTNNNIYQGHLAENETQPIYFDPYVTFPEWYVIPDNKTWGWPSSKVILVNLEESKQWGWENTLNFRLLVWSNMFWYIYFSFLFGILGVELRRFALFVIAMGKQGVHDIWLQMIYSPRFMDPFTATQLIEVIFVAALIALVGKIFKLESLIYMVAICAMLIDQLEQQVDRHFRQMCGCDELQGPETVFFAHGTWQNCDDWQCAWKFSWGYAMFTYVAIILTCLGFSLLKKNSTVKTWIRSFAVSFKASKYFEQWLAGVETEKIRRMMEETTDPVIKQELKAELVDIREKILYVFWGMVVFFILCHILIRWAVRKYKKEKDDDSVKRKCCCVGCVAFLMGGGDGFTGKDGCCTNFLSNLMIFLYWLFYIFAFPMFLIEKALRWLHVWAGKRIAKSAIKDAHRGVFDGEEHNKVVFETRVESTEAEEEDSSDEFKIIETSGELKSKSKKKRSKKNRKRSEGRSRSSDVKGMEIELAGAGETLDLEAGEGHGGKNL